MKMKSVVSAAAAFALAATAFAGELPQYFPAAYAEEVAASEIEPLIVTYDGKPFWGYFNGTETLGFTCAIPFEHEEITYGATTVGELRKKYSGIRFDGFELTSCSDDRFDTSVLTCAVRIQTGTDPATWTTWDCGELDSNYLDFSYLDAVPDENVILSLGYDFWWHDDLSDKGFKSGEVIRFNAVDETRTTYEFDMTRMPVFTGVASVDENGKVSVHTVEYLNFDDEFNFGGSLYGEFNQKYHSVGFMNFRPIYVNGQPVPEDSGRTTMHVIIYDETNTWHGACYTGWDSNTWITDDLYDQTNLDGNDYLTSRKVLDNYTFAGVTVGTDIENVELCGISDGDIVEVTYRELFEEKSEVSTDIETPPEAADVPAEDRITSITINPAFNMKHKHDNSVELDLTKIKIKAKEIYDEEGLKRASEALGEELKGNTHYNLLDMTLLYNDQDISNDYSGLVKVVIPIPKGHRNKTFSCYRLTTVGGKTEKEVIPGIQTEDSYIIYLEHFSEYALVGVGEDIPDEPIVTTPAADFYKIDIKTDGNGKASADVENVEKVEVGTEVTLTATPNSGYKFSKWTVTKGNIAIKENKFTMPESDVEIKAEFIENTSDNPTKPGKPEKPEDPGVTTPAEEFYKITLKTDGHGKASANVENAEKVKEGTEVTLTATPDSGYKFSKWTVTKGDITIKDNKFTMPAGDVEITAEFAKKPSSGGSSGGGSSGGSRRPNRVSSAAAETVTVNGKSGSWSDVSSAINSAANGATITISGSVEIPSDVIAAAAKKNVKLEVKVNDTYTWVIDAAKVGEGSKYLSVSDAVINETNKTIKSGESSKSFRVTESKLGTGASLRYNAGKSSSGKFANLFRVNGSALEFVCAVKVDAAGNALLPITAAGAYKVVLSDETKLVGDLDNSTGLNALDAAMMLKKLVNNEVTADETAKFDYNGDGKANALDAAALLKMIVS